MRKIFFKIKPIFIIVSLFLLVFYLLLSKTQTATAAITCDQPNFFNEYVCSDSPNCPNVSINYTSGQGYAGGAFDAQDLTYSIEVQNTSIKYRVHDEFAWDTSDYSEEFPPPITSPLTPRLSRQGQDILRYTGPGYYHQLYVEGQSPGRGWINYCGPFPYSIEVVSPTPKPTTTPDYTCDYDIISSNTDQSRITPFDTVFISNGKITPVLGGSLPSITKLGAFSKLLGSPPSPGETATPINSQTTPSSIDFGGNPGGRIGSLLNYGEYVINIVDASSGYSRYSSKKTNCLQKHFWVTDSGIQPTIVPTLLPGQPTYTPIPPVPSLAPLCEQIDSKYEGKCKECLDVTHGIWTAIGCVPTNLELILKDYIFVYGVGIAGGIAFLYFLYGVFLILTSAGNAEKIAEGKEIIISALSGLFLIIFSVFLLRVIGYDILKIPGFS